MNSKRIVRAVMFATALLALASCGESGGGDCPAGTLGCPCEGGATCGEGLTCGDGLCVAETCPTGTSGCACFGNGTCLDDGTCINGTCVEEAPCPEGTGGCSCFGNGTCLDPFVCAGGTCLSEDECPPGTSGCSCTEENICGSGLSCIDNLCRDNETGCIDGQEGCPCKAGDKCGMSTLGESLACMDGLCSAASCPTGMTGCACASLSTCAEETDLCVDGFCQPMDCVPGALSCACAGGSCAPGLICRDGIICVEAEGLLGGPCYGDGTCSEGYRCSEGTCVPCALGSMDCACKAGGDCQPGYTCWKDICRDQDALGDLPPNAPLCYTPCTADYVAEDGTFVPCSSEGLMAGCFGGHDCVDGSCVLPGVAPPTCTKETDCPGFQTCLFGTCYSNCEDDQECGDGRICHKHVCRDVCDTTDGAATGCPEGASCVTQDGESGVCLPVEAPEGTPQTTVEGEFSLSTDGIDFSNVKTSTTVVLTNMGPTYETFTVRKRRHTAWMEDGTTQSDDDPWGDDVECNPAMDCPLYWLSMGPVGEVTPQQEFQIGVDGSGGTAQFKIEAADSGPSTKWDGRIEVIHPKYGPRTMLVGYSERPEGRWGGNIYYFANFGDTELDGWAATPETKESQALVTKVNNAFIRRWFAFRKGNISWDEFLAVVMATRTESWRWPSVIQACEETDGACYPYDIDMDGIVVYTTDSATNPIPSGVVEMPFAMDLYAPDPAGSPELLEGRIATEIALQYPASPAVTLTFGADPATCQKQTSSACLVYIDGLQANVDLGGRYVTTSSDGACGEVEAGYGLTAIPWLVPGFERATEEDPATGLRYRYECRDTWLPLNPGPGIEITQEDQDANLSMGAANPIPDARARRRTLEVIDGALVNQERMFLIFRERFESFLPGDEDSFSAYGFMLLDRQAADLKMDDDDGDGVADTFEGSVPWDDRVEPEDLLDVECSPDLVEFVLGYGNDTITDSNVEALVQGLIDGVVPTDTTPEVIGENSGEEVHYLCLANGLFDGGSGAVTSQWTGIPNDKSCGKDDWQNLDAEDDEPETTDVSPYADNGSCDDGGPGSSTGICPVGTDLGDCPVRTADDGDYRVPCPAGSDVIYFTVDSAQLTQSGIAAEDCQEDGSCEETLEEWIMTGDPIVQYKPVWQCEDPNQVYCDDDRKDLRNGKVFYAAYEEAAVLTPLYPAIDLAFRYKTQFRNREGKGIAFAPEICIPGSNQIPYCYSPWEIEEARARIDCLLHIWRNHYDELQAASPAKAMLDEYLCTNFSYTEACHPGMEQTGFPHDGFERLYSELLVMMGDESYTSAFASRFDLAGTGGATFEGSLFEPGGIDLSAAAGLEMRLLYQAAQYYQEALDRFYALSPLFWESMGHVTEGPRNFVTQETVTWYLERLTRAATQKSRAWSEVAKRYQNLNRPDLSRSVLERAYIATYIESIVLSQLMVRVTDTLKPQDRPQVALVLDQAQKRYRMAMLDMRNVYAAITDEVNFFGFSADYIPFPTLNQYEDNGFEVILKRAQQKIDVAKYREDLAINKNTAFETDGEEFQAELVRLRMNYEAQLGDICGSFEGPDGKIYPAIERYAYLDDNAQAYGDPCGLMGTGSIHQARVQYEQSALDMKKVLASEQNLLDEIAIEKSRVEAQCDLILDLAQFVYDQGEEAENLQSAINWMRFATGTLDRMLNVYSTTLSFASQGLAGACVTPAYLGAAIPANAAAIGMEAACTALQHDIAEINMETAQWQTQAQCDQALIDSNARTASLLLQTRTLELDALRAAHQIQLMLSEIQQQQNRAKRLEQELSESLQLQINVAAAKNDPNVRIYRNDAIVNADISFNDALREVYRLTLMYEFYVGMTYPDREKLFLIRMIQFGDYNLENYVTDLVNTYWEFEETYGWPDLRVAIISLRDDIFKIPQLDDQGGAMSQSDRIDVLRERLTDPTLLDENGYIRIPFSTKLDELCPLTRNHKIKHMESEIIGSDVGDTLGRLYIRQVGTSTVHGLSGDKMYYRLPERTCVLNPYFNGNRVFSTEVYQSVRLRERPFVNTAWELYINQRDEHENQDIDLNSLTDIRLYIYYRDFTAF